MRTVVVIAIVYMIGMLIAVLYVLATEPRGKVLEP